MTSQDSSAQVTAAKPNRASGSNSPVKSPSSTNKGVKGASKTSKKFCRVANYNKELNLIFNACPKQKWLD